MHACGFLISIDIEEEDQLERVAGMHAVIRYNDIRSKRGVITDEGFIVLTSRLDLLGKKWSRRFFSLHDIP